MPKKNKPRIKIGSLENPTRKTPQGVFDIIPMLRKKLPTQQRGRKKK